MRVRLLIAAALAVALPFAGATPAQAHDHGSAKPRIIVSQDGEVDDMDSFIRFLYYANEFDIEGIVYSSSRYHWAGDGATVAPYRWTGTAWVNEYIDLYAKLYPNLRRHAPGYPTPAALRSLYKIGNVSNVSEMERVTDGSRLIEKVILDDEPGPLYIQSWGGLNTTARALKSIQERYQGSPRWPSLQRKISQKVVIYNILNQDATLDGYIKPNWPGLKIVDNQSQFWSFAYLWTRQVPASLQYALKAPYMEENFLTGHGKLLERYRTYRDGKPTPGDDENNRWRPDQNLTYAVHDFISEGDSPSFLYLLDFNGLRSSEDPAYGGWGGRFAPNATGWIDTADVNPATGAADRAYPQTRWVADLQNDFAARADWGVTPRYREANHNPRASVREGLSVAAKPGRKVTLHGRGSDPDGDRLAYRWWQYTDADTYPGTVTLDNSNKSVTSFTVPADAAPGQTIHLILEVTDDGSPALKHYQRVILTVR
ncbi:nucleoside hydrolase-like domain-containing protein [Actinoplanes sp. NPDC000266]